jgi:transcriptional regulator with XRE-family HTH domain
MAKRGTRQAQLLELLKQVRNEAGLRQIDLATRLKQPQSYISKYESGERRLDLLELNHVCKACGISLVEFVKRFDGSGS